MGSDEQETAPSEVPAAAVDDSAARLAASEEATRQIFDQLLRLKAEFENYRKRVDREKPDLIAHGKREIIERLFPLYDVLSAAHLQVARHADGDTPSAGELVRGLELIFKEFAKLFEAEGVAAMDCVGKPFDFDRHEAMGQVETDEFPEGTVVAELQRGYTLGGKTLRSAKVRVAAPKK